MPEALGTTTVGTYGVTDLFTEQRKFDKDKSKFFVWRERGHAAMVHVLITKMKKVAVMDPEPKHFEDGYRQFEFPSNLDSASSSGALEDEIRFTDADAAQLQAQDLLKVEGGADASGLWVGITASVITYGNRSVTLPTEEIIEVVSKGTPSGGNTVVTIRRGIGATLPTTPPNIPSGVKFWHVGDVNEDGQGVRASFTQNAVVVNNFIQIFGVPYEITDITQRVDIFGENEWQRKARNARRDFARRLERAFLSGIQYSQTGPDNQLKWYTGGLDEFIAKDTDHRISAGRPISQTYFNSVLGDVFLTGSTVKFGFSGYAFITKLANAAADKVRYNERMSNDLGLDVSTFSAAGGGIVHLIPDFEMSQMGKGSELYLADIAYLQYMFLTGEDIRIDKGKTGTGLQSNDRKKTIHQIYGVVGLKRSFKDSHFHLYNLT